MINIEFGGGDTPIKPNYKQCDIRDLPGIDYVCSAWGIDKYVDFNSVDVVFSRHMFEHLTYEQGGLALDAWFNILKAGGTCEIILPDMLYHIKQWLDPRRKTRIIKGSGTMLERAMYGIFGKQREGMTDIWDIHKSGYDFELLKDTMEKHNFTNIKHVRDVAKNLHVIGIKK